MKELLNDRIDILVDKARQGDFTSQFKLAKSFYYGKLVKRSLPLARYWAYKAVTHIDNNHNSDVYKLFCSTMAPHFTNNEQYVSFGESYDISLTSGQAMGSSKFRGKFDKYTEDERYYRTYYISRFIVFYFIRGAYRVLEPSAGSYRIYGKEKAHFKEYWKWLIPFFLLALYFVIRIVV